MFHLPNCENPLGIPYLSSALVLWFSIFKVPSHDSCVPPELLCIGGTCVNVLMIICKMCMLSAELCTGGSLLSHDAYIVIYIELCIGGKRFFPFFILYLRNTKSSCIGIYLFIGCNRTNASETKLNRKLFGTACLHKKFTEEGKKVSLSYYVIKMCTRLEFRTLVCTTTCRTKGLTNGVIGFNVIYLNTYQI